MNLNNKKNDILCHGMIRIRFSEVSVSLYRTTRPQISKDSIVRSHRREILNLSLNKLFIRDEKKRITYVIVAEVSNRAV
jgi:hypothetical protein